MIFKSSLDILLEAEEDEKVDLTNPPEEPDDKNLPDPKDSDVDGVDDEDEEEPKDDEDEEEPKDDEDEEEPKEDDEDESSEPEQPNPETKGDPVSNLSLLNDFSDLYFNIKHNIDLLGDIKKGGVLETKVVTQVISNMNLLYANVLRYISDLYEKKSYVENLYQYNCYIHAYKINIEMLKKIRDLNP